MAEPRHGEPLPRPLVVVAGVVAVPCVAAVPRPLVVVAGVVAVPCVAALPRPLVVVAGVVAVPCLAALPRPFSAFSLQGNHARHLVEVKTLAAADEPSVVVVLPGGENEEAALSAGIETATSWFGEGCEAILL